MEKNIAHIYKLLSNKVKRKKNSGNFPLLIKIAEIYN